jgi:hypothetical protein
VAEAGAAGFTPPELMASVTAAAREHPTPVVSAGAEVLVEAVRAAGHERAVFSRADLAGQVAARLPTLARSAAETVQAVEELTEVALGLAEAVGVGEHPRGRTPRASDARWAAADVLAAEARVLSLAERGRGRGYGQVDGLLLEVRLLAAGLDPSQREAVRQLAGDGDFLSVLTAPAGSGKTHTLGTATAAWQAAGYRVVGLAPSARAAGELAAATGDRADTLAKRLGNQTRLRALTADELAWSLLDDSTVVIVDEASMANTLDLAKLTSAAARAAAKVVLVGDPAQIGVVRGPGGMLAALAHAGHGIELAGVHRFDQDWERAASLVLRRGDPKILDTYQGAGRLHPCAAGDAAIEAVHAHWAAARADGAEVLMMARSRADVEALNARARAAQVAAFRIGGPVNRLGEHDWQVGDLLRAKRNDRRIPVGEGHVRNGDRYWVADAQGPGGGLIVSDLDGRNRAVLPPEYVAAHAEYGWAATIDAAQGATTGIGILLVRPGLDREHLYVGLTRGRAENHAYIAPDPVGEADHHGPAQHGTRSDRTPEQAARDVLATALASSGAQDAAHTARARAAERAQQLAELAALQTEHRHHVTRLDELRAEYADLPRFAPRRRPALAESIDRHETARTRLQPVLNGLTVQINELTRQVDRDTANRQDAANREETQRLGANLTRQRPGNELAQPRPVEIVTAIGSRHAADLERARRLREYHAQDRDAARRREDARRRDDGYGIGR